MVDIKIVIAVNKKDVWFCRICVASIRYYYPDVEIFLLKDELNGKFATKEIEKKFGVKVYDCGKKIFGWAASKTFFLLQAEKGKRFLIMDSDIVFIEPFLERILSEMDNANFIVSGDLYSDVYSQHVKETYFDTEKLLEFDPEYKYPGFLFNTGQIFVTGGLVTNEDLSEFFNSEAYPFWKRRDLFPLVDQSVYNYVFPRLHNAERIKLHSQKFMIWSESKEAKMLELNNVISKTATGGVIHWAGAKRTPFIQKMTRNDIIEFFQNEYYKYDILGTVKILWRKYLFVSNSYFQRIKHKMKNSVK